MSSSFLASRDRVKGAPTVPVRPGGSGARRGWAEVRLLSPGFGATGRPLACRTVAPTVVDRLAAVRERQLDLVEVTHHDRALEHGLHLPFELAGVDLRGHVVHGQHPHVRVARDLRGLHTRRMGRLGRALAVLVEERALVDEQVGAAGGDDRAVAWPGIAGEHDPAAAAGRTHHLAGLDPAHGLAALQLPELRAGRRAEGGGALGVEPAGPVVLDEHVANGRAAVARRERLQPVAVEPQRLVDVELLDLQRVAEAPEGRLDPLEHAPQPGMSEELERTVAIAEVVGLEQTRQAEPMVGVQVRDEDRVDLGQTDGAHELALGALAAIDEDPVAASTEQGG